MPTGRHLAVILASLFVLGGLFTIGADEHTAREAAQRKLVERWVAAVNSHDEARVKLFIHPKVLACINSSNKEYFDFLVTQSFALTPPANYQLTLGPVTNGGAVPGIPPEMFTYPVTPTHQFQIDWTGSDNQANGVIRAIAPFGNQWFVVYPCPNAEGVKFFRERIAEGRMQNEKTQKLVAELKDPLRSQMKDLLKRGQKIEAVKKYRAATGSDMTTAVLVANSLESSAN
jgi:hypothetical protein